MKRKRIILLVCIGIILLIIWRISITPSPSSKEGLSKFYNEHKEMLNHVALYMQDKQDIIFDKRDGRNMNAIEESHVNDGSDKFIIPPNIRSDMREILNHYGFETICKDIGAIIFMKESDLGSYKALIYYNKGGYPFEKSKAIEYADLGDGWYYYYGK